MREYWNKILSGLILYFSDYYIAFEYWDDVYDNNAEADEWRYYWENHDA